MSEANLTPSRGGAPTAPRNDERLTQEVDALRAAGHTLGPWLPADPDLVEDLELLDGARQCACACGLLLVAGWDANSAFALVRGVGGAYDSDTDQRTIDDDLEASRHGPCPAALALVDFHRSAGFLAFSEAYND
jgi:hypothetical protein